MLTIVVNLLYHDESVYTQLFYVPILLAAIWYGRKAIYLAAFFGALHMSVNYLATGAFDPSTLLRAGIFVVIAVIATMIVGQKDRLNRQLAESNAEIANVIEFDPDATLVIDAGGRVVAWNKAIEEMTGVKAADMIGKGNLEYALPFYGRRMPMLIDLVGMSPEEIRAKYSDVTVSGERLEAVTTMAKMQGNDAPVLHVTAGKLYDSKGRVTGAIESVRDVTAQKRMENELAAKLKELEFQHEELEQQEEELTRQNDELQRVLNRLKESEEKYRVIVESVNDAICVITPAKAFAFFNRRAEEVTGYRGDDLIGHSVLDLVDAGARPRVSDGIDHMFRGKVVPAYEMSLARKDGRPVPLEMNASLVNDAAGNPAALIVAFRDITLRKQAGDILKRYQLLSEYANDIILFVKADGRIIEANDAAVLAYGYRRDELLAMCIGDLRAGDSPETISRQMARADRGGIIFEAVHRSKDGRLIPVEVSSRGVTMGDERVLLSVIRDITERKRVETALQASEARFRSIFEDSAVGIYLTDMDGHITDSNEAIREMLGYSGPELQKLTIKDITARDDYGDDRRRLDEMRDGAFDSYQVEKRYLRKDGGIMVGRLFKSAVRDPAGRPLYGISMVEDFTERKAGEEALSYKNKELGIIGGIAAIINRAGSIEETLEGTLHGSLELLGMDAGAIYLTDPADRSRMLLRAFVPRTEAGLGVEPQKYVRADASLNAERVFYLDDGGTPLFDQIFVGRTAVVIVPVLLKGFATGLMAFYSCAQESRRGERLDLLSIAVQLGVAIDNHTLLRTLRATSNYMAEIINESPDAIVTADAQGNIISSNKRAARLLQYDMLELSGMNVCQLLPPGAAPLPPEDRSYVRDFQRKDGTTITLNISTSHMESGDVPGGFIIALKDLSEIAGLKIVPIAETAIEGDRKYHFEKGLLYLLDKTQSGDCMDIFADQVKHNVQGLCVTRHSPKKIREAYGLEKTPIVWLNGSDFQTGESCIKPDNLTGLGATVYKFLSEANEGIVLLDGVEYLVARNSFDSVLKFLHLLNDRVMVSNSSVLICLDPLSLETRQFHLLQTEMRTFKEP